MKIALKQSKRRSTFGGQDNELFEGSFKMHVGLPDREARQAIGKYESWAWERIGGFRFGRHQ